MQVRVEIVAQVFTPQEIYKPPVNGITRYEMKTVSVRERIEIKLLGRQRLFKRNSYQIRRNEYSKDDVRLRASHG